MNNDSPDLRQPQVEAESVDTPQFRELLDKYDDEASYGSIKQGRAALITHIDSLITAQVAAAEAVKQLDLDELATECKRLHDALCFWLPQVPDAEGPMRDRVVNDAYMLVGYDDMPDKQTAEELGWIGTLAASQAAPSAERPLRYTSDGELAECPCCGSLDVGGGHHTVHCYKCKLSLTAPGPLQNAIDKWNRRTNVASQAAPAKAEGIPDVLFDGNEVYAEITRKLGKSHCHNHETVSATLDAVVRLMRRAAPSTPAKEPT